MRRRIVKIGPYFLFCLILWVFGSMDRAEFLRAWREKAVRELGPEAAGLLPVSGGVNTPTLVDWSSCPDSRASNTGTTYRLRKPNASLANNLLVLWFFHDSAVSPTTVVSIDSAGATLDTMTLIAAASGTDGNSQKEATYYVAGCQAGAVGYKITFSAANNYFQACQGEWYNVATSSPLDGTGAWVSQVAGTTAYRSGSFNTAVNGSLIIQMTIEDSASPYDGTLFTADTGYTFLYTDLADGGCAQYTIQATAGATNPTITYNPGSSGASSTVAFKAAAAGTAPAAGAIRVQRMQGHTAKSNVTSFTAQFPATGNLIALNWTGYNGTNNTHCKITAITDTGGNTWNVRATASQTAQANPPATSPWFDIQAWDTVAPVTANSLKLTLTTDNPTYPSVVNADCGLVLFDIVNASATPFDNAHGSTGNQTVPVTYFDTVSITPGQAGCLLICGMNQDIGTTNALKSADTTALFLSPLADEWSGGFNTMIQDRGVALVAPSTSSAFMFSFGNTVANIGTSVGAWAAVAVSYFKNPGPTVYSQTHFRFRNDDGDEVTATAIDAQDASITRDGTLNTRLRTEVDTTNDPPSIAPRQTYRRIDSLDMRTLKPPGA